MAANGAFAPLYTAVEQKLIADGLKLTWEVLRGYAWHASPIGTCYPGVRRLATLLRRGEPTIERERDRLIEMDYMRIHRLWNPMKRKEELYFQISPMVLYISPGEDNKNIEDAWRLWKDGTNDFCNLGSQIVTEYVQPDSEPESEPESEPIHEPDSRTKYRTTTTTKYSGGEENPDLQSQRTAQQNGHTGKNPNGHNNGHINQPNGEESANRKTREAENNPPRSAPPPPVPLEKFHEPLAYPDAERIALRLRDLGTRIAQARQLVTQYDMANIESGLTWLEEERRVSRQVKNPIGLLKWWLEKNAIMPGETPPSPYLSGKYKDFISTGDDDDGSRYISGEYGDIIQH